MRSLQLGLNGMTPTQVFEIDANFHEMLAEYSGNVFMHQSMQQQNLLRQHLSHACHATGAAIAAVRSGKAA